MRRRIAIVILGLYWTAIFWGTHTPGQFHSVHAGDKVLHFGAFAGLAFLLSWCLAGFRPTRGAAVLMLSVAVVYGAVDELTQFFVPFRSPDVWDWAADVGGALAGLTCYRASLMLMQVASIGFRGSAATQTSLTSAEV
jgi:VanZ family protein